MALAHKEAHAWRTPTCMEDTPRSSSMASTSPYIEVVSLPAGWPLPSVRLLGAGMLRRNVSTSLHGQEEHTVR